MPYIAWIALSLLPSIVWLLYFLRKDAHPEPSSKILKVFIIGMIFAAIAVIPIIVIDIFSDTQILEFLATSGFVLSAVILAPTTEEILKYSVVAIFVMKNSDCDEPIDLMIYAITAAMGFAALENILFLFPEIKSFEYMLRDSAARFMGATLLHALASGILGYFLAISIFNTKKRKIFILSGIGSAIVLHSLYNSFIILSGTNRIFLAMAFILLFVLLIIVFSCFRKLKKIKSVCKI